MKDYIIHNGRKYYAMGGDNGDGDEEPQQQPPTINPNWFVSKTNKKGINNNNNFSLISTNNTVQTSKKNKSPDHGSYFFTNLDGDVDYFDNNSQKMIKIPKKKAFRNARDIIADYLEKNASDDVTPEELKTYRHNTRYDKNGETYDDDLSAKFRGLFHYYTGVYDGNEDESPDERSKAPIYLGQNATYTAVGLHHSKNKSLAIPAEQQIIRGKYPNETIKTFYRADAGDGNKIYTLEFDNGDTQDIVLDAKGNVWEFQSENNKRTENGKQQSSGNYTALVNVGQGHRNRVNSNFERVGIQPNSEGFSVTKHNAYGGRTTRYYAVGGTTGEQIPIGEVQQNDYNMIGEGGSHEENPMGGVPYGVNQDGTQNMVEEGEVSVGNNVFSDRTQMSPELCQQLGLPEGTTPAQAMQQIEQLYEQGQIGDEEFQEIQQIIFQDQEAQKQGAEGNIEQMQSEMPSEGIQPDMMQGASMPPEMMQQGAQPMQPPMQQGAPEGIQPEMVQGYGFGGRRWGCR